MKRKLLKAFSILMSLTFLSGCSSPASRGIETATVAPIMNNHQCGYIDENGNIVINLIFKDCGSFSDNGLAPALKNDKYGYINRIFSCLASY